MFHNDYIKIIFLVGFFTLYTFILLWLTNFALLQILPGYTSVKDEKLGLVVFFIAALTYTFYARWRGWYDWKYYVLGALMVYFPLVFIAAAIQTIYSPNNEQLIRYVSEYCINGPEVCGKAFAHTMYSLSLRALPTVLTAPALFWYLLFKRQINEERGQNEHP